MNEDDPPAHEGTDCYNSMLVDSVDDSGEHEAQSERHGYTVVLSNPLSISNLTNLRYFSNCRNSMYFCTNSFINHI
jgi:hemolysin activation/secretion protein